MKFWFDTEFHDDGTTIELISIGIVSEGDREYYAVCSEYDAARATPWISEHVLPFLVSTNRRTREEIRNDIFQFVEEGSAHDKAPSIPEFWSYCGEYDWIVLRQLFGDLMAWPSAWPIFAMDIAQWRVHLGSPELPKQTDGHHNALSDARHVRACWLELDRLRQSIA